jgi:hypothetical protein
MNATDFLTSGQAADEITRLTGHQILSWRVQRLFELRVFPDPGRIARCRAIPRAMIPDIIAAMRDRGWLPAEEPVHV